MDNILRYITALSNLYGIVHKEKVLEIYNVQNEDQVNLETIEKIFNDLPKELEDAFINTRKEGYFVQEAVSGLNEFESLQMVKGDKPYYIPEKNDLLKYEDESYYEEIPEYLAFLDYINKNFLSV